MIGGHMIRELSREEIKEKEAYIESLRGEEEYRYYFTEESKEPTRAWQSAGYYVDLTEYDGHYYLGVIKLESGEVKGFEFIALIRKLLNEYRRIFLWCHIKNKKSMRFHEMLEKKLKAKRAIKENFSVIMLEKGGK